MHWDIGFEVTCILIVMALMSELRMRWMWEGYIESKTKMMFGYSPRKTRMMSKRMLKIII